MKASVFDQVLEVLIGQNVTELSDSYEDDHATFVDVMNTLLNKKFLMLFKVTEDAFEVLIFKLQKCGFKFNCCREK